MKKPKNKEEELSKADETTENQEKETSEGADEMYEHYNFVVDKGQSLLRIDKYLYGHIENVSRNKIQQAAKAGNILVNGIAEKPNYKVKPLDTVSVLMSQPPKEFEVIPEDIPIDIVYEDDDLVIVNKKPGMVVHPAYGNYTGTLVNALSYHFGGNRKEDGSIQNPFLVHRIDKDTSGIMIVAKNEYAQAKLASQFYYKTIERKYHALVWGDMKEDQGTIESYVGRSEADRRVMRVFFDSDKGKYAITHWKVLERFGYVTLVECQLETGRTHQIRIHMKHIGHPLFNDYVYGGNKILKGTIYSKYKQFVKNCFKLMPRQGLHAKILKFIHPTTEEIMYFNSDLPEDMQNVIDKWREYSTHKQFEEDNYNE
ncbi:MAG: RluA family pseudouridine synthase [Bacteroidales bacterium]|nr:RluA family pseudouridine synthase [Bacteroidales bacterium]